MTMPMDILRSEIENQIKMLCIKFKVSMRDMPIQMRVASARPDRYAVYVVFVSEGVEPSLCAHESSVHHLWANCC